MAAQADRVAAEQAEADRVAAEQAEAARVAAEQAEAARVTVQQEQQQIQAEAARVAAQQEQQEIQAAQAPADPAGCDIKGNIADDGERIYHVPGGGSYNATKINLSKGERMFCSENEAITAGWRKADNS